MNASQLSRLAGWSAYVSAGAMLAGAVVVIVMDSGRLVKLENLTTITLALSMVPLALALHRLHRARQPGLALAAAVTGPAAMLAAAGVKFLVFIGAASSEGVADFLDDATFTLIGVWLIVVGSMGWRAQIPSAGLAGAAVAAGAGQVLVTIGFLISEPPPLWALAGGGVTLVAYPLWAITIGRWLLRAAGSRQAGGALAS